MTEGSTQISPDGVWAWNGQQWVPNRRAGDGWATGTPPGSTSDGKAIASLILGVLWAGGIASVGAVILGHLSRSAAKRAGRQPSGLALAGLILGYLGIAGSVLAASSSITAFQDQRESGRNSQIKAELFHAATLEASYFSAHKTYSQDEAAVGIHPLDGVTVLIATADESGYCLVGSHPDAHQGPWYYASRSGLSTTPCI